jgi:hypothetical protein
MGMPLAHRRFTVDEYYRMAEAGILGEDDRVELLDGEIVEMTPIGERHAAAVTRLDDLFHEFVGDRATIRVQNPVRLHRYAEPEPDVALVAPREDRYAGGHPGPADILLIVEVADTSLPYDRERKLPAYAAAGIPEVWLVDLTAERIEVYREPVGEAYRDRRILGRDATLTILALPDLAVEAGDVLG